MRWTSGLCWMWLAMLAAMTLADGAAAGENFFSHCWRKTARDVARNNHWPEPFVYPDRDATVRPFGAMIAKGWQVQNTLSAYHFEPGDGQLAEAGILKVQQILSDPAPHRRTIFVQLGATPQQTAARINAIRMASTEIVPPGMPIAVYPSSIQTRPWPAEITDYTFKKFQTSQPAPKLPAMSRSSDK